MNRKIRVLKKLFICKRKSCKNEFYDYPSEIRSYCSNYCRSKTIYNSSKFGKIVKKKIYKNCLRCNTRFIISPSKVDKVKHCSLFCRKGARMNRLMERLNPNNCFHAYMLFNSGFSISFLADRYKVPYLNMKKVIIKEIKTKNIFPSIY